MIVENCVRKLTKIKFTSINFGQVVPYGIDAMVYVIITITKINFQNLKSGARKNYLKLNYCCFSGFFCLLRLTLEKIREIQFQDFPPCK